MPFYIDELARRVGGVKKSLIKLDSGLCGVYHDAHGKNDRQREG